MDTPESSKILIADDDSLVREAVHKILTMFGHEVVAVASGEEAVETVANDFDVIILDINMPGMDGFETLSAISEKNFDIPIVFLTGAGSMEYAVKAINLGAYDFITKPIEDLDIFNIKINRAIEKRSFVLKEKAYKDDLEREVKEKTKELNKKNVLLEEYSQNLETAAINTMSSLQVALEEKDQYTAGHTTRVTYYASVIAKAMELKEEDCLILQRACEVHDIGKLIIDVSYIQKPGALTDEEWALMKKHPEIGESIVKPLAFMEKELFIVRHHHERIDGRGYPDGLTGDQLDILTKIITVADSYDAMTSKRSYKQNMSIQEGIVEMRKCAGAQFDPDVVETFITVLEKNQ